jgi:pimeloyl-ACP methyl ester carboxylesterase
LGINKSHFIGVSLGSVIITKISEKYPDLVDKIVLSGAITSFSFRTLFLLRTVQIIKGVIPNIVLYRLFAWIIMPRKGHQKSRQIFIKKPKKLRPTPSKNG